MFKENVSNILEPGKLVRISSKKLWFLSIWACDLTSPKKPILNKSRLDDFDAEVPLLTLTSEQIYILDDTFVQGAFFLFDTKVIGVFTSHVNEHLTELIEEAGNSGVNK